MTGKSPDEERKAAKRRLGLVKCVSVSLWIFITKVLMFVREFKSDRMAGEAEAYT